MKQITTILFVFVCIVPTLAQEPNIKDIASYLDARENVWFAWGPSKKGETRCISCHTNVTYALVRPQLAKTLGKEPLVYNNKLLANTKKRVNGWEHNRLFYGGSKAAQSRGTESILNALILANDDRSRSSDQISNTTRKAFDIMWNLQHSDGKSAGSWEWLDFDLEPWESSDGAYYGAILAAIAVGIAPGNYQDSDDIQEKITILRRYLLERYGNQQLSGNKKLATYYKIYLLWASQLLPELLNDDQQAALVKKLFEYQNDDGGWALSSLGMWSRRDITPTESASDGIATGLIVFAAKQTGLSEKKNENIKRGVAWLKANYDSENGRWRAFSLNADRTNGSEPVKGFMNDAATSFAALALFGEMKKMDEQIRLTIKGSPGEPIQIWHRGDHKGNGADIIFTGHINEAGLLVVAVPKAHLLIGKPTRSSGTPHKFHEETANEKTIELTGFVEDNGK